ncbi:MAG: glycosyltransferase family 2 protein [Desulfuromonadales bacterium]|nr:glycosyltransferase family 2 protein [Desulfuromonadales bacterium]
MLNDFPKVALVVPVFNAIRDTMTFLYSVSEISYKNYEIILVDDGSSDGTAQKVSEIFPEVRVLKGDGSLWWAGGTNLGVSDALNRGAEFILTINNDNKVAQDFLDCLVETALINPRCVIKSVGYDLSDRQKICSFGGEIVWWKGAIEQVIKGAVGACRIVEVPLANGNSTLIPAQVFREIGFFDEINCPQYHADSEFLLRARKKGYKILVDRESKIYNKSEKSVGGTMLHCLNFGKLLFDRRSPYFFKANYTIYKNYCPHKFYQFFLLLRYYFMVKTVLRNRSVC